MNPGPSKNRNVDKLLQEFEGWIITKNEKGKVKIATCEEDESNIYEKTRDWIENATDTTKTDTLKLPPHKANAVALFFIRDLLNSEKMDCYFRLWDIIFNQVYLCGTITSLYVKNENYFITVDDGTSSINCIIKREELQQLKKNKVINVPVDPNENIVKAVLILKQHIERLKDCIPSADELTLGKMVKIIGKMTEYNGIRYIFIRKIKKVTEDSEHLYYIEHIAEVYRNHYEKITI